METEESDHCREEAVAERLKQEPVNCMDCPPKNSRSGEVAVGGGLTVIQEYFQSNWDGSRGRVQGVRTPPPEMTCGFLIQLVFCKKKKLCGLLVLK